MLSLSGNLQVVTKPGGQGGAGLGTVISAVNGTLSTVGDIVTTDGGGLRIEAADVKLGSLTGRDAERRLDRELGLPGVAGHDHGGRLCPRSRRAPDG